MKEIMSKIFEKIIKRTSLETRLNNVNQLNFIDLITDLGYRENKKWTEEEDELFQKLNDAVHKATEEQIEIVKQWIADGCPK